MFNMIDPLLKTTPLGHPLFGGLQKGALFENSPNSLQEGVNPPSGGGEFSPNLPQCWGDLKLIIFSVPQAKIPQWKKCPHRTYPILSIKYTTFLPSEGILKGFVVFFEKI